MAKQEITLKIADTSIRFSIDREKEEVYRLAEREANRYLAKIRALNVQDWTEKHYLVMAVLQFAINSVRDRRRTETDDEDLRRLEALSAEIDTYLNSPSAE